MDGRRSIRTRKLVLLIGSVGLVFFLFACQQEVNSSRTDESASATVEIEGGSVRLENGAQALFEESFFAREAEVTLTSSPVPQAPPVSADETYAASVEALGPSVTLILPYEALGSLEGGFAERKQLRLHLPDAEATGVAESDTATWTEVLIRFPDGTELFYLEAGRSDTERSDTGRAQANTGIDTSTDEVVLNNLQLKSEAQSGTLTVRVRRVIVSKDAALSTQTVPSGFVLEDAVTGLNQGVAFDFASGGRIFISEKRGVVRVAEQGELKSEPFIDLSDDVNSRHDRGMLGLAVHPDFPAQPYVYLLFTYDPPELPKDAAIGGPDGNGARVSRLVRVKADETKDYNVALPGSEKVLLGTNSTYANIGNPNERNGPPSCDENGVYVRDCLPADEQSHTIGAVRFAPDGSLFVSNGDGANYTKTEPYTTRALSLDSLAGKVIRINPLTGEGYADNPFYNGDPNSNRSKVYSSGLRNPFRFTLNPETGEPFIGDVGRGTWEEVNTGKGANFGWPCFEGGNGENLQQGGFRALNVCQTFYEDERVTPPLYSYTRSGTSASIQVGDFYTGTRYPDAYRDALFITDYNQRWIRTLTFDANGGAASVNDFGDERGVVQMLAGPGGNLGDDLYLMNIEQGKLKRLRYTAAGNTPPEAQASATDATGEVPLTVSFSSADSVDADGDTLTYMWDFGDGETSTDANPTHTYEEVSLYRARLTVTDSAGASATDTVLIEAGTTQPVAVILSPADGATFTVGDQVPFIASNQGETLSDKDFSWFLKLNHNEHQHFDELPPTMGEDGAFVVPDHGDNTSLELCLEVMQNGNKSDPSCVTLELNTVEYMLETEPSGLKLSWEGVERTAPFTVQTNVNARQQLTALAEQEGLAFVSWSDGGERIHDITVQDTMQSLTATYAPSPQACGELTQEAEAGALFGAFRTVESPSASGGRYIDTPDGFGHEEDEVNPEHRAEYCLNVTEAGRYKVTGWVQGARKSDSFYLAVDGVFADDRWDTPRNSSFEPQDAVRRGQAPFTFDLEPGEHTLSIYLREDGAKLDKVALEKVDTTTTDTCGGLIQEAEAGALFGAFRTVSSASASGASYIDTPDGFGHQESRINSDHRAEYCVNVTEAGRYKVTGWVQGASKSDSFYLAVDGTPAGERWDTPRNRRFEPQDAARRNKSPFTFDLDAGEHTVSIYLREDGTRLDKLELIQVE